MKKIIIPILIVTIVLLGVSFAWFNYSREGSNQKLITSNLYLHLNDESNNVLLNNVYPLSPTEARELTDNVIEFSVEGMNTGSQNIYYEIKLLYGEDDANLIRFRDQDLRFDLVEVDENNNETYLLEAVTYQNINNKRIWVETIDGNTQEEVVKNYKLRVWVSDTVLISDTDPNATYTAHKETSTDFKNHYASIKLEVYGDFIEKKIDNPYQVVKMDYKSNGATLYTGASQDSLDGYGHQPIYYYTSGENTNVLFNDICWQMIRTTDTGGVKMIYNGDVEEKEVFDSYKTLTDNDITYTNDATYPFTYSDGKWTSGAVEDNKTGTITFNVKENGYYTINYDISTQEYYDWMYIYVDNKEIRRDSGITEGSVRLGNLTSSNVIKISYTKNANTVAGRDNIIFSVTKGQGESTRVKSCDTGRPNGIGLSGSASNLNLNDADYYYASSYTYTDSGFTLSSDATLARWSDATYQNLIGKYVCNNKGTTCTELHYVQTYNSNIQAGTSKYTIAPKRSYTEIGTTDYNEHYTSMSSVGYMYNINYEYKTKTYIQETILTGYTFALNHNFSDSINWNSATNKYELVNGGTVTNANSIKNKYTFASSTTTTYPTIRYVVGVSGSTAYYISMTNEGTHNLEYFDTAYTYGTSISEEDGKYRINNSTTIHKTDWFTGYSAVNGKYVCVGESSLCNKEDLRYVTATGNSYMRYFLVETSYRFGSDISYSNGKYTLTGTTVDIKDWPHNYNNTITNTHYTCFNEEGSNECGDTIYYVYWVDGANIRYIELENGKKYDDALYEMINYKGSNTQKIDADINKYDSAVKQMIDHWYEHTALTNKTSYLEDTVYCNDRTILNNDLRNWVPNGIVTNTWTLYFKMYSTNVRTNELTCENVTDRFSLNNGKAKLTYPVGLLTEQERALMMNKSGGTYAKTKLYWWLASTYGINSGSAFERIANNTGGTGSYYVHHAYGARPAVSLTLDTKFTSGDGGYDTPYLMD